jgi:hypothetical protein
VENQFAQLKIELDELKFDFYKGKYMIYTAHQIASESDLYNKSVYIDSTKNKWECMGYSKFGNSVKFSRLVVLENNYLKQINKYVHPDTSCITD